MEFSGTIFNGMVVSATTGGGGGAFTHTASGRITPTNAYGNVISGTSEYSTIGGGKDNTITTLDASAYGKNVIVGGSKNNIYSPAGYYGGMNFIGGGGMYDGSAGNTITNGYASVIVGGGAWLGGNKIGNDASVSSPNNSAIVAGDNNYIQNSYSFIGAGYYNRISGETSSIVGGQYNIIGYTSGYAFIGGGSANKTYSIRTAIVAGQSNEIYSSSSNSSIVGGKDNKVYSNSTYGFIGGGQNNVISASTESVIGGGQGNKVYSQNSFIGGGDINRIYSYSNDSIIGGGKGNQIHESDYSSIGGGNNNKIYSQKGTIAGGTTNTINSNNAYSSILGGSFNTVNHLNSHIIGSSITSVSADTTHVQKLNVKTLNGTTAVTALAIDANGQVVDGASLAGSGAFTNSTSEGWTAQGIIFPTTTYGNTMYTDGAIGSNLLGGKNNGIGNSSYVTIGGGLNNNVTDYSDNASIGGGQDNTINNYSNETRIGGGYNNTIGEYGYYSSIGAGEGNEIIGSTEHARIGGGNFNIITSSNYSVIGGGDANHITNSPLSFIGGGNTNDITNTSDYSIIVGGNDSTIGDSTYGFIGGGLQNIITGSTYSSIIGGVSNTVNHDHSHIIGSNITTTQSATTFVENLVVTNGLSTKQVSTGNLSGTLDDYDPGSNTSFISIRATAGVTITGTINGISGKRLVIYGRDLGANTVTLKHQDAGSTAANRFLNGNAGADVVLSGGDTAEYIYDSSTSRWIWIGGSV